MGLLRKDFGAVEKGLKGIKAKDKSDLFKKKLKKYMTDATAEFKRLEQCYQDAESEFQKMAAFFSEDPKVILLFYFIVLFCYVITNFFIFYFI